MISLKRFLEKEDPATPALTRVVQILIQGIGLHAIEGEETDYKGFRETIDSILESLGDQTPLPEFLLHAGAALRTMEEYNRRTSRYLHCQNTELQKMVKMLTSTIGDVVAGSDESLGRLREVEQQIVYVSEVDDIRLIKDKLAICLADIRQEAERQRARREKTLDSLSQSQTLERSQVSAVRSTGGPAVDPATGLPGRSLCEEALARACKAKDPHYAVAIVIENLPAVNLRFGRKAGDAMLQSFGDFIAQVLEPEDYLSHWSGPALVAILSRSETFIRARESFSRLMERKFEHTLRTSSRSILLPVTTRWEIFPMMAVPRLLFQKIDSFIAMQEVGE